MMNNDVKVFNRKGILIVFEGISGSGKSESIQRLMKNLEGKDLDVRLVEWNSNKTIRKIVKSLDKKKLLTAKLYSILQWISFTIDYFTKIKPMLRRRYIVIADRYVYTALTRDVANNAGKRLSTILMKRFRKPDLLFYCNTPPSVCQERIRKRGKQLFHTNKSLHKSTTIVDKEYYYLKITYEEYERILNNSKVRLDTNIIYLHGDTDKIISVVDKYLYIIKCLAHERIIDFREE